MKKAIGQETWEVKVTDNWSHRTEKGTFTVPVAKIDSKGTYYIMGWNYAVEKMLKKESKAGRYIIGRSYTVTARNVETGEELQYK